MASRKRLDAIMITKQSLIQIGLGGFKTRDRLYRSSNFSVGKGLSLGLCSWGVANKNVLEGTEVWDFV